MASPSGAGSIPPGREFLSHLVRKSSRSRQRTKRNVKDVNGVGADEDPACGTVMLRRAQPVQYSRVSSCSGSDAMVFLTSL